jgi:ABC-type transport system involved in multi-copper enzyme maturation permease subunit
LFIVWGISVVLVSVQAASLISSERSRQTLNVLLTAPISGRRIILEKYHGVRRLLIVLSIPFVTIFWFQDWWRALTSWNYLILSALTVLIYLPLVAWFSLWMGLRIRSQLRAILGTLAVIALWTAAPVALGAGLGASAGARLISNTSPLFVIRSIELIESSRYFQGRVTSWEWTAYVLSFALHGLLLFWFRRQCLRHADRLLGRMPEDPVARVDPALRE